jgi:hypothetical protein
VKARWSPLLLLALASPALAQSGVQFADLDGHTIVATVNYVRTLRRDGVLHHNQQHQRIALRIGPGDRIGQAIHVTVMMRNGRERSTSFRSAHQLNKPRRGRSGHIVWTFSNGTLTRLQTFDQGGKRISIHVSRTGGGFACSIDAPFAQEEGHSGIHTDALMGGGKVELLSVRTVARHCEVH